MTDKVLILHGWGDDSKKGFIPELVKNLKEKGYDAKAFDQPNTDAPKFDEWFKFAEDKIAEIGKDDLNIVGHSMGGLLALKLAEKHKVNKLVLVAPVGSKPSEKYFEQFKEKLDNEELNVFKKYQNREIDAEKIKENAKKINFIFGKEDSWITEEIREFYIEKFKDSKIEILDGKKHMSNDEGVKKIPEIEKLFDKVEEKKEVEEKKDDKKETKTEEKKEEKKNDKDKKKKIEEKKVPKKEEAVAYGRNVRVSKKHAMYVCSFIKNKDIDKAIHDLEEVVKMKKAVPFKGEIPHRKGMMSGRYPVKTAREFINMLKGLKGNVLVNGMELEKTRIVIASASWSNRPMRSGGRKAKRTNVIIRAKEVGKK